MMKILPGGVPCTGLPTHMEAFNYSFDAAYARSGVQSRAGGSDRCTSLPFFWQNRDDTFAINLEVLTA
jgi:hypothetical protein